jgi:hypothetical protein
MNVEQEPVVFRREGFSPSLSLLMPTFSLLHAPARLTAHLPRMQNALLPPNTGPIASVVSLCPFIIRAQTLDQ